MTLTYRRAVAALTERGRFGISLGLARVERLMEEVGHPERDLRGALVGGTNGKGSVVAMTQSVLSASNSVGGPTAAATRSMAGSTRSTAVANAPFASASPSTAIRSR